MVELKNWHKFVALGVIIITLTAASYLVISGLDSNTNPDDIKPELQPQIEPEKHNQEPASSANLPPEVGEVASSTVLGAKLTSVNDVKQPEPVVSGVTNTQNLSAPVVGMPIQEPETSTASPVNPASINEIAVSQSAQKPQDPAETEAWQQFKLTYNKNYLNSSEELKRREVFNENRRYINTFNEQRTALFTLGINQLADMTRDEINQLYFGPPAPTIPPPPVFNMREQSASQNGQLDLRNLLSEPVDQGTCRDSAVFAAVASMESAYNKKFTPPVPMKLSEQQLIDCMAQQDAGQQACQGKFSMVQLFDVLQKYSYSLTSPENYRRLVESSGRRCEIPPDTLYNATKLAGYMSIHQNNILEALYFSGPLCITIDASQSTFHFYQSGLYHELNCSSDTYNHHAVLVGHSSTAEGDLSRSSYLLRNSFGKTWGESGYMRLLKDEQLNKCLPQNLAIFPNIAD